MIRYGKLPRHESDANALGGYLQNHIGDTISRGDIAYNLGMTIPRVAAAWRYIQLTLKENSLVLPVNKRGPLGGIGFTDNGGRYRDYLAQVEKECDVRETQTPARGRVACMQLEESIKQAALESEHAE